MAAATAAAPVKEVGIGILVPTKGAAILRAVLDSAKSYLLGSDEMLLLVNGQQHEPAVRAIVEDFERTEGEHKWALTVEVVPIEMTLAEIRTKYQNLPTTCPKSTHLHHIQEDWPYLPGALIEVRSLLQALSGPDDVLWFEKKDAAKQDACSGILPHTRNWPAWDAMEQDRNKQAVAFYKAALVGKQLHVKDYIKPTVLADKPETWAKWGLESALYGVTLEVRRLLIDRFAKYDAQKRIYIIHFNNQATGGMNHAFGRDPLPGVVKQLVLRVWQNGKLKKIEFVENHAGDIHVEVGPL